jgi:hypothetical protein
MPTRLRESLDIVEAPHCLRCVDFKGFHLTGSDSSHRNGGLSDAWRTMKKNDIGVRTRPQILAQACLDFRVSGNSVEILGSTGFTPHALSS